MTEFSKKCMKTTEIKNEIFETRKWEEKTQREDLKYKTKTYTCDFQHHELIRSFSESIYSRKASIVEAEEDERSLLKNLVEFDNKSRPKNKETKD